MQRRKMGITDDVIDKITDWVQSEFLPKQRVKYLDIINTDAFGLTYSNIYDTANYIGLGF